MHFCGLRSFKEHRPQSKSSIISSLRPTGTQALFVDDHPENCLDVLNNNPQVEVLLMQRRFNADFHHPRIQRVKTWGAIFERVGLEV